jgi:magnesium-transporting ATPase (P-type)
MPVDGIVLRERGQILTDESAMTGESIEQKKASLHNCLMRKEEKLKELEFSKGSLDAHSLPSPVILSGTQV